jgi:predicted  nucleic acid-binding Zn-ribbon protein
VLAALWAMEKLEYNLRGIEFELVTDHKAMEELKKKVELGSKRVIRWFERLEQFNFVVTYRKGVNMEQADALSRPVEIEDEKRRHINEYVLKLHEKNDHRKTFKEGIMFEGQRISRSY